VENEKAEEEFASHTDSQDNAAVEAENTEEDVKLNHTIEEEEPVQVVDVAEETPSKKPDKGGSFFDQLD
jgi:hypothetical protein